MQNSPLRSAAMTRRWIGSDHFVVKRRKTVAFTLSRSKARAIIGAWGLSD
jgi:hypothetical protein